VKRLRPWVLAALVVLSFAVHSRFVLRGCGEQDEARFLTDAIVWHLTGQLDPVFSDYRVWTSPLYIQGIKKILDWGVPRRVLPDVLNWSNVAFGTLTLIPMYLLLRRLANARAALAACVLYSFVPAFWLANLYGMPHLPSFGLFLAALLGFAHALEGGRRRFALGAALAGLCMAGACALKADVVLCAGAFLGVLIAEKRLTLRNAVVAALIVGLGVGAVMGYSRLIAPSVRPIADFQAGIPGDFPFEFAKAFTEWNQRVTVRAFGPVLFVAVLLGILSSATAGGASRRLLLLALLWSVPPQIVWGMKFGNSARHMMAPALPLVALVGVALAGRFRRARWPWLIAAALLAGNYFSTARDPAKADPAAQLAGSEDAMQRHVDALYTDTVVPSTRIFESALGIQERVAALHARGREFADLPGQKKLLVGLGTNPYALYELLADARRASLRGPCNNFAGEMAVETRDGQAQRIEWVYARIDTAADLVAARRREGWLVWTMEPRDQSAR